MCKYLLQPFCILSLTQAYFRIHQESTGYVRIIPSIFADGTGYQILLSLYIQHFQPDTDTFRCQKLHYRQIFSGKKHCCRCLRRRCRTAARCITKVHFFIVFDDKILFQSVFHRFCAPHLSSIPRFYKILSQGNTVIVVMIDSVDFLFYQNTLLLIPNFRFPAGLPPGMAKSSPETDFPHSASRPQ